MKAALALCLALALAQVAAAEAVYFQRGLRRELIRFVEGSRHLLQICLPLLSDEGLLKVMREASGRGVKVKLLLHHHFHASRILQGRLQDSGIQLRFAEPNARFLVRDAQHIFLGSFQGSAVSLDSKLESAVWLENPIRAAALVKVFEAEWRKARPEPPEEEVLEDALRALPDPREEADKQPRLKTDRRR